MYPASTRFVEILLLIALTLKRRQPWGSPFELTELLSDRSKNLVAGVGMLRVGCQWPIGREAEPRGELGPGVAEITVVAV